VAEAIRRLPRKAWREIRWKKGENLQWRRQKFAAIRVVSAHGWLQREIHPEGWLIAEQRPDEIRYHFSNLPQETSLRYLATMAHQRWPIEQNYRHLKTELGLDDFAGRKWNGWNHHAVLTAVAYTFLELECFGKIKKGVRVPLPALRKFIRRIFLSLYVAGDRELLEMVIDFERDPPLRS
jgi:SRSO17 transposase